MCTYHKNYDIILFYKKGEIVISEKFNFLYKSIEDATSIIRAMDTKSNVISAIIIAIIFGISKLGFSVLAIFTITLGIIVICGFIYGVVLPGFTPKINTENINLTKDEQKLFFPYGQINVNDLFKSLQDASEETMQKVLLIERLKLQKLIERKIQFFKTTLYWGAFPFFIFTIVTFFSKI